jgi:ABC-type spermidine/putrescine transport system permease subunit II
MKTLFLAAAAALVAAPAMAGDITSTHSVQTVLGVDALSVKNERKASSVSTAGENVTVTSLPSLGAGAAGTAVATTAGVTAGLATAGSPFSYSESAFAGATASAMTPTVAAGAVTALGAADVQTVTNGGVAGTLAGTNLATGVATITAGGAGTQATLTRSNTLSVFQ